MLWRLLAIPVLALALAGVAACGDDDSGDDGSLAETTAPAGDETNAPTNTPTSAPTAEPSVTDAPGTGAPTNAPTAEPSVTVGPGTGAIAVVARDFAFDPATIEAEAGETVVIAFADIGTASHTFTVDELDVDLELLSGESGTVEFTFPDQPLEFYCRIHPLLMRGTLEPGG